MRSKLVACALLFAAPFFFVSCSSQSKPGVARHHDEEHSHGPNDGELIKLGDGENYAELLNDPKKDVVTIFILAKDHTKPAAIEDKEITILVKPGANTVEYKIPAKPQEGDPAGKASRFESDQKDLKRALENQDASRELHVTVEGKPYTPSFPYYEPEEHH